MEKYFGPMGGFLLNKELKIVNVADLNGADEQVRKMLADRIVADCLLTIMSPSRARMAHTELESILEIQMVPVEGAVHRAHF